jgi:hypothetical protein
MPTSPPAGQLAKPAVRAIHWLALSLICLVIDYMTGPVIQFPLVYLVPISLASWYGSRRWGLALAFTLPLFRLYFRTIWEPPWTFGESAINAAIRVTLFGVFAWLTDRTARQMRELRRMHLLENLLGICSDCKKVRDTHDGDWQPLDDYVARYPQDFERDLCPECARRAREVFDRR